MSSDICEVTVAGSYDAVVIGTGQASSYFGVMAPVVGFWVSPSA